jgi:hypothetical protein
VRTFLLFLFAAGLALMPFVVMRQRWAMSFWQKLQLVFVVYAVVILVSAIVALVFRWDDIYG